MIKLELEPSEAMTLAIALAIAKQAETSAHERAEFENLLETVQELRKKEQDEFMQSIKEGSQNEN